MGCLPDSALSHLEYSFRLNNPKSHQAARPDSYSVYFWGASNSVVRHHSQRLGTKRQFAILIFPARNATGLVLRLSYSGRAIRPGGSFELNSFARAIASFSVDAVALALVAFAATILWRPVLFFSIK
ncbi:MAG: hypothetical protein JWQ87_4759 [Candidatus Sulfotelmatobacter sp.]|nr:hypothetical protein [Candidatus Sulfotelmatobacter sp.]